jgi:RNA polymerase sigma-B factor
VVSHVLSSTLSHPTRSTVSESPATAPRSTTDSAPSPEQRDLRAAALFAQLDATSDAAESERLRADIAELYLPVVQQQARRYSGRGESFDDLVQAGCIGLMKAINRFRTDHGSEFMHFALPTINGELKRYFRDFCWTVRPTRRIQELRVDVARAMSELRQTHHREPDVADVAEFLDADRREVEEAIASAGCYSPTSLDAPVDGGRDDTLTAVLGDEDAGFERADAHVMLATAVSRLAPRDRYILGLRFFRGLTQREIADEIGVTQMQVSRLLTRMMLVLREQLETTSIRSAA